MKIDKSVEEINKCLICRDSSIRSDKKFGKYLGLIEPYDIKICGNCGLRWLSPRPTEAGYADLYSYENYFDGKDAVECYPKLAAARRPYFADRIQRIEKHFTRAKKLEVLDIGAATGEFVHEAIKRGHKAMGIELSPGARLEASKNYGLDLLDTPIELLGDENKFDVIHMNHVFEHLPYPNATLAVCHAHLRRGGLLVLEVPQQIYNDLDRLKRVLGIAKQPQFSAYSLHHTYFFVPQTITKLLEKKNFRVRRLTTSNPARTPVRPFNTVNALLTTLLFLSDITHRGGNIIELIAVREP